MDDDGGGILLKIFIRFKRALPYTRTVLHMTSLGNTCQCYENIVLCRVREDLASAKEAVHLINSLAVFL